MRITISLAGLLPLLAAVFVLGAREQDHVALAKEAERSLHRACDEWAAAKAAGRSTTRPAREITRSYFTFMHHIGETHYVPNNAILVPDEIAIAGAMKLDAQEVSYLAGAGQSGVVMSVWFRSEWTKDQLPDHGFLCSLGIEPREARESFVVKEGNWADEERSLLRLHYVLDGISGIIEVRRGANGWTMHPDRGIVKPGRWWHPRGEPPTTRPAE